MGRSKKQLNEAERLEKELKEQRSINRSLKRQLKKTNRDISNASDNSTDDEDEVVEQSPSKNKCPKCAKGVITQTDLGVKILEACSNGCGHRKTTKK